MKYGLPYFTYLSEELPKVVENTFPISGKWEDHFLMGNSMGAQGTIKWALKNPGYFNAAAGMSGIGCLEDLGFLKRFEDTKGNGPFQAAYGSPEEYRGSEEDILFLAKRAAETGERLPRIFSCCGTEDFTYEACRKFAEYAREIGLPLTFMDGPGAHTYDYWEKWMRYIIRWFGLGEVC